MPATAKKNHWDDWVEPEFTVPDLIPLFPIVSFVPGVPCPHKRRLRGTRFVCMGCHKSGFDWHPDLQLKDGDLPDPEKFEPLEATPSEPKPASRSPLPLTRKERRALLFPRTKPEPDTRGRSDEPSDSAADSDSGSDPGASTNAAAD